MSKGIEDSFYTLWLVVHPQMGTMVITTYIYTLYIDIDIIYTHTHLTVVVCMRKLRYQLNIKPVTYI